MEISSVVSLSRGLTICGFNNSLTIPPHLFLVLAGMDFVANQPFGELGHEGRDFAF